MIRHFLLSITLLITIVASSQNENIKKNTVSLEFGGTGFFYSINYDRTLIISENMRFTSNIGTWFIPIVEDRIDFSIIGVTAGVSTLFGKKKHFAEFGLNFSYWYMRDYEDNLFHTILQPIRIGYRYQKDEGGLFLRAAFMPIVSIIQDKDVELFYPVTPHFSASIGYSF